jgi:tRNA threonylcarbamoyladenosine biosynthesis protein TsaB
MLLAINTTMKRLSLALLDNNGKEYLFESEPFIKHSEITLVEIDKLLNKANVKIQDVDNFAVVVGPGSFTGIRIGVSLIKGFMCVNKNAKGIVINSFELMSDANDNKSLNCLIDANSEEFYIGKFINGKQDGELSTILKSDKLENAKILFDEQDCKENYDFIKISPQNLLNVAQYKMKNNIYNDINNIIPLYLKLSQAERELIAKNGNK